MITAIISLRQRKTRNMSIAERKKVIKCAICKKKGHWAKECIHNKDNIAEGEEGGQQVNTATEPPPDSFNIVINDVHV